MAPTPLLAKGRPNDVDFRRLNLGRKWRLVRRAIVLILGFVGLWMFWVDRFWINRLQNKFLDRPSSLLMSASEKARMQEIADLMLVIYKTLSEMRYLNPEAIITGPHNMSHNQHTFDALGLGPSIVYLYSILPYVDVDRAGQDAFFQGGLFIDYRDEEDVEQGRDPFYASPEGTDFDAVDGPYMRPWVTPLSKLGNHQSAIIYDARRHRIWIIDQENWSSSDPAFESVSDRPSQSANSNAFEHMRNRFAPDVLKDINCRYRDLRIFPGGGDDSGREWDHFDMDLANLYRQNGWPDDFHGDDFQINQFRKRCTNKAKDQAEEPLMRVSDAERGVKYAEAQLEKVKQEMMQSESEDEEWRLRFRIWKCKRDIDRASSSLQQAKEAADKFCPNGICQKPEDLPLWELECLKEEYAWKRREYEDEEKDAKNQTTPAFFRVRNELSIYSKALTDSQAAADRLQPGAMLDVSSRERDYTGERIDMARKELVDTTQFLSTVPKSAAGATSFIELEIKQLEKWIDSLEEDRARRSEWEEAEKEEKDRRKMEAVKQASQST